jgi:hypothetical protein
MIICDKQPEESCRVKKESTAHHVRAQKQKRRKFQLAILSTTAHSTALTSGAAAKLIIFFHVSRLILLTATLLTTTVATLLTASVLTATLLATTLSSRCLLTVILAFLAGSTHVSLEIVVLHSVICHVSIPPMYSMINGLTGVQRPRFSGQFSSRLELIQPPCQLSQPCKPLL